jgi:hypothetical protein
MLGQIKYAAQCLLGIDDDWKYSDIEEHLDWLLDNKDEIAEGYPLGVMDYEYRGEILKQVKILLVTK